MVLRPSSRNIEGNPMTLRTDWEDGDRLDATTDIGEAITW
jgi:hypothetical protein